MLVHMYGLHKLQQGYKMSFWCNHPLSHSSNAQFTGLAMWNSRILVMGWQTDNFSVN